MLKRSFLNRQEPAVAMLYRPLSAGEAVAGALSAEYDGADGIAIEISAMPENERSVEVFRKIIDSVQLPFMFIDYRNDVICGADDDKRQEFLLMATDAGADVIDVMGDLYAPAPRELATDCAAIAKQKKLIEQIHARGSFALMSSHAANEFVPPEDVLAMMQEQSSRGADILKVVTAVNSEDEFQEAIRTLLLLNRELDKPFIYLGVGKFGRMIRYIGPKFGVAVTFGVHDYDEKGIYVQQPSIKSFRQVLDNLKWDIRNC